MNECANDSHRSDDNEVLPDDDDPNEVYNLGNDKIRAAAAKDKPMAGDAMPADVEYSSTEQNLFADLGFDERAVKEIQFSLIYAKEFHHGTDGHSRLMLIADLSTVVANMAKTLMSAAKRENMDIQGWLTMIAEGK